MTTEIDQRWVDALAALTPNLISLLCETVRCPSVSGSEESAAGVFAAWARGRGWQIEREHLSSSTLSADETSVHERANLLIHVGADTGRTVILNGHLDVVSAEDLHRWSFPPFAGDFVEGAVRGRGSVDMKGGIVAALGALAALEDCGVELPFRVIVQLAVGEETTGIGTQVAVDNLRRQGNLRAVEAAIILEPTANQVARVNTGLQFFTIELDGISAHSSAPWKGVDALDALIEIRAALRDLALQRGRSYRHSLLASLPSPAPFSVGVLQAGRHRAAVPDFATMSGRFGLLPGEDPEEVRHTLRVLVDRTISSNPWYLDHPARIIWDNQGLPGWETAEDEPLVRALHRAVRSRLGAVEIIGFTAGSDAAWFGAEGIPTVVFGPGDITLAHSPDEQVLVADVVDAAAILASTLVALA
ncbi:ArgE/DapE family deacylase [Rathayibacter sp. VKM Ac-2804]|uniref:M20 family metallopeptidase n=1 Tax=Rathayibacter sp. VKM Ac-2804 TaxID=2609257 RepID=UPI00132F2283|nr:ArgE/DapE family deacylase [Rathayibacter sp. VKM Ac-2804]QHF24548.1 ArgE/DapE family deacylase [Rathayibacter sp. VKM Ac-2804]